MDTPYVMTDNAYSIVYGTYGITLTNITNISITDSDAVTVLDSSSEDYNTLDNRGTITAISTTSGATGVYANANFTAINSGTIRSSGAVAATGVYATTDSSVSNTGSILAEGDTGVATGINMRGGTLTSSGTITATSQSSVARAVYLDSSIATVSGTLSATSQSGAAYAAYLSDAGATISGTLSATSQSNTAYAAYVRGASTLTLEQGAKITSGMVYGTSGARLRQNNPENMSFVLDGTWGTVTQNGAGTWTLLAGSSPEIGEFTINAGTLALASGATSEGRDFTLASGANLSLYATGQNAASAPLQFMNVTTSGSLAVSPTAAAVGADSVLVTASNSLNTTGLSIASANPNYTVTRTGTDASGNITVSTAYTPKSDAPSLALNTAMASVQGFAGVAQARSLSLLEASGSLMAEAAQPAGPILVADNSDSLAGLLAPRTREPVWGVYMEPVYSFGSREGDGTSEGYDSSMVGLEMGMDRTFGNHWIAGAFLGWGTGYVDFNGAAFYSDDSEKQSIYTAGIYTGYRQDEWTITDTLSGTYAEHDSERYTGLSETAEAHYFSWFAHNALQVSYAWSPAEHWTISPRVGLDITYLHRDSFGETGSSSAVRYDALDKTFMQLPLGVRAEREFTYDDITITPYAGAGLVHTLGCGDVTVSQHLSTTTAQVTTQNDDNRFAPEAGIRFALGDASLTLGYSAEIGESSETHNLAGLLRWTF